MLQTFAIMGLQLPIGGRGLNGSIQRLFPCEWTSPTQPGSSKLLIYERSNSPVCPCSWQYSKHLTVESDTSKDDLWLSFWRERHETEVSSHCPMNSHPGRQGFFYPYGSVRVLLGFPQTGGHDAPVGLWMRGIISPKTRQTWPWKSSFGVI